MMMNRALGTAVCALLLLLVPAAGAQAPATRPVDRSRLAAADLVIEDAIKRGDIPGGVLLVGKGGEDVYLKAYGNRSVRPETRPMRVDVVFDLASLTKPIACATSVLVLADRGRISLSDPVARHLPAFGVNGKEKITIEQLLLHRGGLIPDNAMRDYLDGPQKAIERVFTLKPDRPVGRQFWYTDVGYIVLGELVKAVDGRPLDRFAREEIFEPMGMKETAYNPPPELRERCAPCEQREGRWMQGEVHDPRAYALGGVAGHAGLFGTAQDIARYCRMVLRGGVGETGKRILSELMVQEMTSARLLPNGGGSRTLAFDASTPYSSARGDRFEANTTFGHTGFTGTMFWIDPQNDCFVVFLTNRVHPDGKGEIVRLRRRVVTLAAEALLGPAPVRRGDAVAAADGRRDASGPPAEVLCGIDVLKRDAFKPLQGRKVALVTNHTGRDREGNRLVDLLHKAEGVTLVKLFSPEHGLYGALDEKVGHGTDEKTGLKVYSLYGETRRPSKEMLDGVDTLVFDIQDVGARFYTYISTLGLCMEEAAKHGIRMVVLDRPNPITGLLVDGPLAAREHFGFTAYGPIPLVHGMTVGELARLFNEEFGVKCELEVVKAEGWKRAMWWDETGLTWVNPSPNMRNLTQAAIYPAIALIEFTNVSVGRGTDQPFEFFGAPWIDGQKLAAALNGAKLPGLRFVPIEFTPRSSRHANKLCQGVYVLVIDRNAVEPARTGLSIAWHLEKLFGEQFEQGNLVRLLHNTDVYNALWKAEDPAAVPAMWRNELEAFKVTRRKYLMYE